MNQELSLSLVAPSLLFAFCVWLIFNRSLGKKSLIVLFILIIWASLVMGLGSSGFFSKNPLLAPNLAFGFLILFELLRRFFSLEILKRIINSVSLPWLIGIQIYRIVGFEFFNLYSQGFLPAFFAFPAGVGDIFIGLTAPFVAILYYKKTKYSYQLAVIWNILGIADLVIALATGILAFPRPIQFISTSPSTEFISLYPLVIVPLFAVPLALIIHILCLRILKVDKN